MATELSFIILGQTTEQDDRGEVLRVRERSGWRPQSEMLDPLRLIVKRTTRIAIGICLGIGIVLAIGCGSPNKKVTEHMERLRYQWQTNLTQQVNLPEQVLDWTNAAELVLRNNIKLIQSRTEITNAQENVRQVFKD